MKRATLYLPLVATAGLVHPHHHLVAPVPFQAAAVEAGPRLSRSETTTSTTEARIAARIPEAGSERDLGTFMVTCYVLRGETATGSEAGPGTIATDPATIPLGTHLIVAGYGPGIAADTGGAIKGRHIDVWVASEAACIDLGVRYLDVKAAA